MPFPHAKILLSTAEKRGKGNGEDNVSIGSVKSLSNALAHGEESADYTEGGRLGVVALRERVVCFSLKTLKCGVSRAMPARGPLDRCVKFD